MIQIERPSKPLIQSTFLRHIHLSSCGLHKDMILFHHQRHMLISMCYHMVFRRDAEKTAQESALTLSEEWAGWLASEEDTRLIYCTYSQSGTLLCAHIALLTWHSARIHSFSLH